MNSQSCHNLIQIMLYVRDRISCERQNFLRKYGRCDNKYFLATEFPVTPALHRK